MPSLLLELFNNKESSYLLFFSVLSIDRANMRNRTNTSKISFAENRN